MLGNIYTEAARANWTTVPGRTVDGVYDTKNNLIKLTFSENTNVVYAQYFTYDTNGNPTKIECKAQ